MLAQSDRSILLPIINAIGTATFLVDREADGPFYFVAINRWMEHYLGQADEAVAAKKIEEVLPPEAAALAVGRFDKCLALAREVTYETRFTLPEGDRWTLVTLAPLVSEDLANPRIVGTVVDISERKQAEEALRASEEQLRLALDAAQMGIWRWDITSNDVVWSDHVAHLCGMLPGAFEGTYEAYLSLIHPDDKAMVLATIQEALTTGDPYIIEHRLIRPDGSVHWLAAKGKVFTDADGKPVRMTGAVWEVTERKEAEAERKQLNLELESRVAERTAQLEAANKEMEAFSYSVSHDLRGPIRHIEGFSRILLREYGSLLDEQGQDYLQFLQDSAHQMDNIISALMDLSLVSRGELSRQAIDLGRIVRLVGEELQGMEEGRAVTLDIQPTPEVEGDSRLLQVALKNLLENAFKYTRDRTAAVITFGQADTPRGQAFFVRDNGVGFDPRYADKLFMAFQRLHEDEAFEGTGIGLTIVQRIIHRHGGHIWGEGTPDEGAVFYFTL